MRITFAPRPVLACASLLLAGWSFASEPVRLDIRAEFAPEAHPELLLRVLLTDITDGEPTLDELQRAAAEPGSPEHAAWKRRRREIGRMTPAAATMTTEVELPERYRIQFRVYPRSGDNTDYTVVPAAIEEVRAGEPLTVRVKAEPRPPELRLLHEGVPPGTSPPVRWLFSADGKIAEASRDSCRLAKGTTVRARPAGVEATWGVQSFEFEAPPDEGHSLRFEWKDGALARVASETIPVTSRYGGSFAVTLCGESFGLAQAPQHPLATTLVSLKDAVTGLEVARSTTVVLSEGIHGLEEMPGELRWSIRETAFQPALEHSGSVAVHVGEIPAIDLPFRMLTVTDLSPVYSMPRRTFAADSATKERFPARLEVKPRGDERVPSATLQVILPCDYRGKLTFGTEGRGNAHEIDLGKVTGDTVDFRNAVVTRNR